MDDFIVPASDTVDVYRYQDARLQADMLLMKADLSGKDATLTFTFTTPELYGKRNSGKTKTVSPRSYNLYVERREVQ